MRENLTPTRINIARAIAVAADCLELMVFPAFAEGFLSPVNDVLDVAVAIALFALLGWHWAFLPTFIAEMVPIVGLVPTWTAAVLLATGMGGGTTAVPTAALPPAPLVKDERPPEKR
jgi:hypothetical protein